MTREELKGKQTPGAITAKVVFGWGSKPVIHSIEMDRPTATTVMPSRYFTDYPTRVNASGEKIKVLSTEAAKKAGNYVATKEVEMECENEVAANAALYAEAHNVANRTGMWPEDMVERIKELEDVVAHAHRVMLYRGWHTLARPSLEADAWDAVDAAHRAIVTDYEQL